MRLNEEGTRRGRPAARYRHLIEGAGHGFALFGELCGLQQRVLCSIRLASSHKMVMRVISHDACLVRVRIVSLGRLVEFFKFGMAPSLRSEKCAVRIQLCFDAVRKAA
jgi:hypothetical protein